MALWGELCAPSGLGPKPGQMDSVTGHWGLISEGREVGFLGSPSVTEDVGSLLFVCNPFSAKAAQSRASLQCRQSGALWESRTGCQTMKKLSLFSFIHVSTAIKN